MVLLVGFVAALIICVIIARYKGSKSKNKLTLLLQLCFENFIIG